jgi:hypothetical protein
MTQEQKAARRKYQADWARRTYAANAGRRRATARRFRLRHLELVKARERAYEKKHSETRRKKSLRHYHENRAVRIAYNKRYCKLTWERRLECKRKQQARDRLLRNSAYFANLLRNSLIRALAGNPKASSALKLLGCPIDLFKLHLQAQFRDGMAWNNHGIIWHIDHILPCASFDLRDPTQQAVCFHYTNMQPLLVTENLKKGDKVLR